MNKFVSLLIVALTGALSGCMAEPIDTDEIDSELMDDAREVPLETDATGGCPSTYRTSIAVYYWTTKPLCNTQPIVSCAIEALTSDGAPACKTLVCRDYVYYCNPQDRNL